MTLQRILNAFSVLVGPDKAGSAWPGGARGDEPPSRVFVNPHTAMGVPAANACVSILAGTLARLPYQVTTRGPIFEPFAAHPAAALGRIEIAESDISTDAQRRAVETFLAQLRGAENTFEVPIERPSAGDLTEDTPLAVSAAALSSGELEVTVSGATDGLVAGDYVRIGGRLYLLTSDLDTSKCTVEPPAVPDTSEDVVWEDVTCLARLAVGGGGGSIPLLWTPDFGGPWAIDWEEAV